MKFFVIGEGGGDVRVNAVGKDTLKLRCVLDVVLVHFERSVVILHYSLSCAGVERCWFNRDGQACFRIRIDESLHMN
jgi:hypothetical protein